MSRQGRSARGSPASIPATPFPYCYFMALVSGDEWLLEAQIDLAMNLAHQGIYGYHNNTQPFSITWNSATPTAYWTGLFGQFQADAISRARLGSTHSRPCLWPRASGPLGIRLSASRHGSQWRLHSD